VRRYIEWGGYRRKGQRGWFDPSVYCFLAGFATLDFERATAVATGATAGAEAPAAAAAAAGVGASEPAGEAASGETAPGGGAGDGGSDGRGERAHDPSLDELLGRAASDTGSTQPSPAGAPLSARARAAWARTKMLLGIWT
jgi:hypothetical protein